MSPKKKQDDCSCPDEVMPSPSATESSPATGAGNLETQAGTPQPEEPLTGDFSDWTGSEGSEPTLSPETAATAITAEGVWHNSKKITGLFSSAHSRNSWIGVPGLGWRKLADNSDPVVMALTDLAAHAKQLNSNVNLKEENNKIVEMYVW